MAEITSTGDQMLAALEAVAEHGPLSAAELARLRGLNRTVAHRLLATLHRRGYVRRSAGGYVVGPTVARLARSVEPELLTATVPAVSRLAEDVGETVVVHAVDADEAIVVAQALGDRHVVRVQHEEGSRHSLAVGASGRVLLAFQPEALVDRVARSTGDAAALRQHLEEIRERGYAVSHDELQPGVHGLAVPVCDGGGIALASVAIVVPESRAEALPGYVERLREARAEIEARLRDLARA